jgi:PAS domain S-box-containing protein
VRHSRSRDYDALTISSPAPAVSGSVEQMDLATVITALQSVSSELELDRLLHAIVVATAEHAGAERVVLLLGTGDELRVAAEGGSVESPRIHPSPLAVAATHLPAAAYDHVTRTHEIVNLADPAQADLFRAGVEPGSARPLSLLCLPLLARASFVGILYLEHRSIADAFTTERIDLARLLASQAATALENARIHAQLKRENETRRRAEAVLAGERDVLERIAEGEERFRQFADAMPEVVWITDLAPERVVYCSPSFERIWGRSVAELLARPRLWTDTIHPEDRARVAEKFSRWVEGSEAKYEDVEFRIVRPDGGIRWIRDIGVVSKNRQGMPYRVGGIASDITAQKLADEAQRRAEAELAHLNRVATMGELTASIAHEVSQPLAAIVTSAGAGARWLKANPPNLERARETLARIARDGSRATDVVVRLRALFRKTDLTREIFVVDEVVRDVEGFVCGDLRRRRIALEIHASEPAAVWGSRVQVQQVLLNLVLNAMEAIEAGSGADPVIEIGTTAAEPGFVEIMVRDTGIGLDAESAERLFEAFYTTKTSGMGMGLSVARTIVEAHGGRIAARANDGAGARIAFTLPLAPKT